MRAVPPSLSHLTALTALDLSGNRSLEIVPSDVATFSCLTGLHDLVIWGVLAAWGGRHGLHGKLAGTCPWRHATEPDAGAALHQHRLTKLLLLPACSAWPGLAA